METSHIAELCCAAPYAFCLEGAELYGDTTEPAVSTVIDSAHPVLSSWASAGLSVRGDQILVRVVLYASSFRYDSTTSMIDSIQGASVYTYDTVSRLFTVKNYHVSYTDRTYQLIPDLTSELDWIGTKAYWYVGGCVLPYYGRNVNAIVDVGIDLGELDSLVFSESSLSFSKQEAYHVKLQNYRNSKP